MFLLVFNIVLLLAVILGSILFRKRLATRILKEALETDKNEYPDDVFDKMVTLVSRAICGFVIGLPAIALLQFFYSQVPEGLNYLPASIPMTAAGIIGFFLFTMSLFESARVNNRAHRDGLIRPRDNPSKQDA